MRATSCLAVAAMIAAGHSAAANVSLKNGNFFVDYTDVVYPSTVMELKAERSYNSKSSFRGIWGWGWDTALELYLELGGDATITVHEYGGGAGYLFAKVGSPTREEIAAEVATILHANVKPEGERAVYQKQLESNAGFRAQEWRALVTKKKVTAPEIPIGTVLVSDRFSHESITRTADGYVRTVDNRSESFTRDGLLARITDTNGNYIAYGRDGHARISTVRDNFGRSFTLSYTPKNLVARLVATDGKLTKTAMYRYDTDDNLIYSKDVDNNIFDYRYDDRGRHNMVAIHYADKTTLEIGYHTRQGQENVDHVRDLNENTATIKDRDGTMTVYSYFTDPMDSTHTIVATEVVSADGEPSSTTRYDYFHDRTRGGEDYEARMITDLDGDRTDTSYDGACRMPTSIVHGGEHTSFRYDARCRVTYKDTPTEITELAYDDHAGKVSRVERTSKSNAKQNSWSTFTYDDKANVITAENSEGKKVKLAYDANGRIAVLDSLGANPTIRFTYNQASKPITIAADGIGTITITYTSNSEVEKVDSSGGRAVSLTITRTFQELLDVIRPAGVSLSF